MGRQKLIRDHVADHQRLTAPQDRGCDEGPEGRDEHQHRTGDHPGNGQRPDHPREDAEARCIQVIGGLKEAPVDPLQSGVDRKHHDRHPAVHQPEDNREVVRKERQRSLDQTQRSERDVDQAGVGAQDREPGIRANEEVCPERNHERQQQRIAPAGSPAGDEVGQRVAEQQAEPGCENCDVGGSQESVQVEGVEDPGEVLGVELPDDSSEGAAFQEAVDENHHERRQEEDRQPGGRRREQQPCTE